MAKPEAVHLGHDDVGDHRVHALVLEYFERLHAVRRFDHDMPFGFEPGAQQRRSAA